VQIQLIAVGERMPGWVQTGFQEYAKRLPKECRLVLREIAPAIRGKSGGPSLWRQAEGERMLSALTGSDHAIALDVAGRTWSTEQLAASLERWLSSARRVSLLVGGPDGLSEDCLLRADERWSLSTLTFPHPLVRVIVAEQIYRAWSLLQGHPYHRD
jgi:23S rRNA (pseudouridine1915-N3)-methyltransferase